MAQMMQIHTSIEDIDESAASLGDSLDESFSEGADASRKLNKQLDKTEKTFKKTKYPITTLHSPSVMVHPAHLPRAMLPQPHCNLSKT